MSGCTVTTLFNTDPEEQIHPAGDDEAATAVGEGCGVATVPHEHTSTASATSHLCITWYDVARGQKVPGDSKIR
jgi:hypothetical protein